MGAYDGNSMSMWMLHLYSQNRAYLERQAQGTNGLDPLSYLNTDPLSEAVRSLRAEATHKLAKSLEERGVSPATARAWAEAEIRQGER